MGYLNICPRRRRKRVNNELGQNECRLNININCHDVVVMMAFIEKEYED